MRGETHPRLHTKFCVQFQSAPLMRGETYGGRNNCFHGNDFNPLPSCEGRLAVTVPPPSFNYFNPLPSCEGRPSHQWDCQYNQHFNPLPSCEGRRVLVPVPSVLLMISIRSPHARGDKMRFIAFIAYCDFNPLPSCEGRRLNSVKDLLRNDFNPLPSCEGRPFPCELLQNHFTISIRSPHARGDDKADETASLLSYDFNPLPSCEGRRAQRRPQRVGGAISIRSPHARGDVSSFAISPFLYHFNPLPSCEGRLKFLGHRLFVLSISIRSPHARGDLRMQSRPASQRISIRSPHARGDVSVTTLADNTQISIRSPHARGDAAKNRGLHTAKYFNPLPSCEGRHVPAMKSAYCRLFQSAPLMRGETRTSRQRFVQ